MHSLRYAIRALRKNPGFTIPAILALCLGIGAVTAIFSVVDCVLLRPLPYPEADRLISISTYLTDDQVEFLASTEFLRWGLANHVLASFAAIGRNGAASWIGLEGSERIDAARVTVNFLSTLKTPPFMGRDFAPEEGLSGGPDAAILTHAFWQSRFGGRSDAIGKLVNIDGVSYQVAGVLPKGFVYLPSHNPVDVLLPMQIPPDMISNRDQMRSWQSIGRLKPGVTLAQVRAEFAPMVEEARRGFPRLYKNAELRVTPYRERIAGGSRLVLLLLLGAVACVLLIACANVANLLLARGAARRQELAVRAALGATRLRLMRQLLAESVVLALIGGGAGAGIAFGIIALLRSVAAGKLPRIGELTVDARVLVFAFLLSLATGVIFGLLPAVSASQMNIKGPARGGMLRGILVTAELAFSLTLLVSAGLLFQSLWRLQHRNLGFNPESLVIADISTNGSRFAQAPENVLYSELRDRLGGLPGTVSLAFADGFPPGGGCCGTSFVREGVRVPNRSHGEMLTVRDVSPEYFQTAGIPLKRGRFFTAADRDVVIINETLARMYFPHEDPIGVRINFPPRPIVGIVADVKNDGLANPVLPEMCLPLTGAAAAGNTKGGLNTKVLLRTFAAPRGVVPAILQELRQMDPRMLVTVRTMQERFAGETAAPRLQSELFGSFAAVALLLAMVGIYGVIAYSVANRTKEIGIRMALGADGGRVIRLVLREAALPVATGIALGVCGSVASTRYLQSLLYDVKANDPLTYAAVAGVLALAALAAGIRPALRAARVDPMTVLRAE
jgi:putative ABC transport system permease protein